MLPHASPPKRARVCVSSGVGSLCRPKIHADFRNAHPLGAEYPGLTMAGRDVEVITPEYHETRHTLSVGNLLPLTTRIRLDPGAPEPSASAPQQLGMRSVMRSVAGYEPLRTDEGTFVEAVFGSRQAAEKEIRSHEAAARFGPLFGQFAHCLATLAHPEVFLATVGAGVVDPAPAGQKYRPIRFFESVWREPNPSFWNMVLAEDLDRMAQDSGLVLRLSLVVLVCVQVRLGPRIRWPV